MNGVIGVEVRLSIVIPIWNRVEYLFGCLDSIPTVEGVEVVVVDDGSDVDIETVCRQRQDYGRLRFIRQEHKGVLTARRHGCEKATGEYVWFVDSDDEVRSIPYIPKVDMIRYKQNYGWMCIGDKIYRRELALEAFKEMGDLKLNHCEDGIFYLIAAKKASTIIDSDESIYRYVRRGDSVSNRFNPNIISERELLIDWCAKLDEHADRSMLSKDAFVAIACSLCKWPSTWSQLKQTCRSLVKSRLLADGMNLIQKDPYAKKMLFAVRHPLCVQLYRFLKSQRQCNYDKTEP